MKCIPVGRVSESAVEHEQEGVLGYRIAYAHVGGAIVHDSVAEAEYRETLDKARGMARALGARLPDERIATRAAARAG